MGEEAWVIKYQKLRIIRFIRTTWLGGWSFMLKWIFFFAFFLELLFPIRRRLPLWYLGAAGSLWNTVHHDLGGEKKITFSFVNDWEYSTNFPRYRYCTVCTSIVMHAYLFIKHIRSREKHLKILLFNLHKKVN